MVAIMVTAIPVTGRVGIAGLEGVDGIRPPCHAYLLLDFCDDFARGGALLLRACGDGNSEQGRDHDERLNGFSSQSGEPPADRSSGIL